ncbi:amino acid transporter [Corynebacterium sp. sy017]|uniref:LysE/ArgO family amino acid transporter n=1 Tax=unclassified Corynebacterium TaxID=2624378 RepID=UPI001185DD4E|nr:MULTISPECIES: LysE/ArgO family amino acid transporter [unclassified Corynebacterium]MBP3089047.1 amino acid transporter [Corynebacterium sp. sy017]QDZ42410.1 amino acid transporter [Corynebacterium sp. sy039]TSD91365.1 amino acid transporter [Corynebacterium sp. SY003]
MSIALSGFLLGLSLIVAIGPQNALIIKQGIKREGVVAILIVCMLSDVLLIFSGTAGVGVLINKAPVMMTVLKWLGACYLAWFSYSCFRDAWKNDQALTISSSAEDNADYTNTKTEDYAAIPAGSGNVATKTRPQRTQQKTWVKPVLAALAFTYLNPVAYVDTLVMLGGIANQHGPEGRWIFATGALVASLMWFPLLGFGAIKFSSVLAKPTAWKIINFAIGCIMLSMCIRLILH